jgi:hypothetical protein
MMGILLILGFLALLILGWSWFLAQNGCDPNIKSPVLFQGESMMVSFEGWRSC